MASCQLINLDTVREYAADYGATLKESFGTHPYLLEHGKHAQYFSTLREVFIFIRDFLEPAR